MAGTHFTFYSFKQLLRLNIGMCDRLDEYRDESITILYCSFNGIDNEVVNISLQEILRNSDSMVNHEHDYFFVLPYTDKFGAKTVKSMFDDFCGKSLDSFVLSYPVDGENVEELFASLQNSASILYKDDLEYLDRFSQLS